MTEESTHHLLQQAMNESLLGRSCIRYTNIIMANKLKQNGLNTSVCNVLCRAWWNLNGWESEVQLRDSLKVELY